MASRHRRVAEILRAIVHEIRTEKITFVAGSIAYHAFLSILPLLLLVLTLVQQTESDTLQTSIVNIMHAVLTPESSAIIQEGLSDADSSVSLLGAAFLIWGAMRIFRGLDTAFSDIYETGRANTFVDQLRDGIVLLLTVTVAIVAASYIGSQFRISGTGVLSLLLRSIATSMGLFLVFYPMYYIFPDTDISALEVVPGTAFAAGGVTIAQAIFVTFKSGSVGGNLVASILVLLTWLYVVGLVMLIGVAVNAVMSNRSRDVDIDPVLGGVPKRSTHSGPAIERSALLDQLDSIVEGLDQGGSRMTIQFDGDGEFELDRPHTASVDRPSGVYGLDDAVSLTLHWWPDESG